MSGAEHKYPTNPLKSLLETLRPLGVLARQLADGLSKSTPQRGTATQRPELPGRNHLGSMGCAPYLRRSIQDALFAQGFIHAQERLWQMDFNRRLGAGRLSEILGPDAVPLDRWLRTLGIRRISEAQPAETDPEALALMETYAAGVNAFIDKGDYPVEMDLLDYHPEPWVPADSHRLDQDDGLGAQCELGDRNPTGKTDRYIRTGKSC